MYIVIYTEYDQICISKWSFRISKLSSWTRRRSCVCGRGLEQKEESANLFCDLLFETAEWTCSKTTKIGNHLLHRFIGFPSLAVSDVQKDHGFVNWFLIVEPGFWRVCQPVGFEAIGKTASRKGWINMSSLECRDANVLWTFSLREDGFNLKTKDSTKSEIDPLCCRHNFT